MHKEEIQQRKLRGRPQLKESVWSAVPGAAEKQVRGETQCGGTPKCIVEEVLSISRSLIEKQGELGIWAYKDF
jgi:hypothetical protein